MLAEPLGSAEPRLKITAVEDGKKKEREGKGRHKKSRKRYISPIRGEAPHKRIFTKFCTSGDMLDVIICANFGVEKLKGLGNTRGQILEFPRSPLQQGWRYRAACDIVTCKTLNVSELNLRRWQSLHG